MDDFPALVNTPEYHAYVRNLKAWRRKYFPTKATLAFVAISPSFEPRRIFRGAADPKKVFYFYNPYRRGHLRRGIYSALMKAPKLEPSVKNILGHGLKQLLEENPDSKSLRDYGSIHRFLTEFGHSRLCLLDLHEEPVPTYHVESMLLEGQLNDKLIDRVKRLECKGCVVLWKEMGTCVQKVLNDAGVHAEVGYFPFPGANWEKSIQEIAMAIAKIART